MRFCRPLSVLLVTTLALVSACGSTTEPKPLQGEYALASTVSSDSSNTTYIRGLESLSAGNVGLDNALEYSGYATIGSVGEMFFVASGSAPKITRYAIDSTGTAQEDGVVSFSQHVDEAPLYANTFANETTAYLDRGDTGHVRWNPSEMTINESRRIEQVPKKVQGLSSFRAFRRGTVVRGDLVFQPYHWRGEDYYEFADKSKIVVINGETNEVVDTFDVPCPGMDVGTKDADGNIYFTNWVNATAAPVIDGEEDSHDTCAVKIAAGTTEVADSWPKDLAEMTGGREVAAMRIIDGSKALAAVLDHEKVDPSSDTDPQAVTYAQNWELWRLNLAEGTGSKVPGTDYIAGGYYAFQLGGKTVVALPDADYAHTTVFEIPAEGEAVELFDTNGWVYQMVEL